MFLKNAVIAPTANEWNIFKIINLTISLTRKFYKIILSPNPVLPL
jgi:hypothetical protein